MHRWVWDLHIPRPIPRATNIRSPQFPRTHPRSPLGPTALPGSHGAPDGKRKSYAVSFTVKMDPRVKNSAAALEKKFHSETRLASLLSDTSKDVAQAESIREPLQKLSQQAEGPTRDAVQAFQAKLTLVLGAPAGFASPPTDAATLTRVNAQVATLYGQVWQADGEPTVAQSEAMAAVERDASDAMKRWQALKITDLPALNRILRGVNLPEVQIESDSHKEESGMDEE